MKARPTSRAAEYHRGMVRRAPLASPYRIAVAPLVFLTACGGTAIIDPGGSGAGGAGGATSANATSSTTTSSNATTTSTTSGPSGCVTHEQCPDGNLCIFSTGQCAPACAGESCDGCGAGSLCDGCATSSCGDCADCLGACRPIEQGECDDDDPCAGAGQTCVFQLRACTTACDPTNPNDTCPEECQPCGTGSCCGCDDCVAICVPN